MPDESEDELAFDLIDRLHKSLRVSGHDAQTLGRVLGVNPNTIRNYLSGRTHPTRGMLIGWALAVDHGVTIEWLETGEGAGPNPPKSRQEESGVALDPIAAFAARKRRNGRTRRDDDSDTRTYPDRIAA